MVKYGAKKALKIPGSMDPIKLADEIKGDMAEEWLDRREKVKPKPLLAQ